MNRRIGLPDPSTVKAADQLSKGGYDTAGIQPLPSPYTPGRVTPAELGITDPGAELTFIVIGDHGGVSNPNPQDAVAEALAKETGCAFIYTVGDIVYFNADAAQYAPQFYEPYASVRLPIIGIPGNHDHDTTDDPSRKPLDTFMANFCTKTAGRPAADPQDEFGRDTQTQPSHDFALDLEAVTIIGVATNAISGGHLEPEQIAWATQAIKDSRANVPLVFADHHPAKSIDAHHGGSAYMDATLDAIFVAAGRYPDWVISGHVHDLQAFTRTLPGGQTMRYGVFGNSGYYHRHALAGDYEPGMTVAPGIVCDYADADNWGYGKLTVNGGKITAEYVQVTPGTATVSL